MEDTIALIINHALELILVPLLVWLFTKAKTALEAQASTKWGGVANTAVYEAVDAVEQVFGNRPGSEKKKLAVDTAKASLGATQIKAIERATGVPIDKTLDTKVEASVRAANAVKATAVSGPLTVPRRS